MLINAMLVESDFTYLNRKIEKGCILEFPSKHQVVMSWTTTEGTMMQAIMLSAYADVFKNDFYDIVRFVFENKQHLSLIRFRK
jgi:hypothetical protein